MIRNLPWKFRSVGGASLLLPDRVLDAPQTLALAVRVRATGDDDEDGDEAPDENDPCINALVTAESTDSYGDVVVQKGIDFSRFKLNPVFTFQHETQDASLPALGYAEKWWDATVKTGRGKLRREVPATAMRIRFNVNKPGDVADVPGNLARAYLKMYRNGTLRSFSIHFAPKPGGMRGGWEMSPEEREALGIAEYGVLWEKTLLLSVGAVTVPACMEAVALSAGACSASDFRALASRVDALDRQLTELRSRPPSDPTPPTAPAATTATRAEGGTADEPGAPTAAHAEPAPFAAPAGPSSDQIAAVLASMRR